ncbi:carboxymuconolactone decarboxylase family protein [[Mycobacterium] vasticus]|uniref:Carboxymuconolactone decarboxylase family protein n=1 Tax=[Mycobacterium] vasticus TaxID=2875777 RepID=A0ABU5YR39_9MYCO|nr:carboxymuconolactone decarboxylase family protein [Mycolicibacter sp. MYC017]MEB3067577.1 carboxymuconolactone decarboxylase family protein [Mycolicibacter sp. MYC017]
MSEVDATGIAARMQRDGTWNPLWDGLDDLDPTWTGQYLSAVMQPYESGLLSPREVQLLCIAVDAACTHLYAPGLRRHIRAALDLGVTREEILEVLKLSTTVGIHSINVGLPILLEEAGQSPGMG